MGKKRNSNTQSSAVPAEPGDEDVTGELDTSTEEGEEGVTGDADAELHEGSGRVNLDAGTDVIAESDGSDDTSSTGEEEGEESLEESATAEPSLEQSSEAEQLATALAAAVTASQKPAVPVNDIPETRVPGVFQGSDIPDEAPVVTPTSKVPSVSLPIVNIPVRVDVKSQQANIQFQLIIDRLQDYATTMAPNAAVSAANGKAQQLNLWRVIQQVLKLEGSDFIKGYTLLLDFVAKHRNAHFSDRYIYRFFGDMAVSAIDRKNFNRLLNLMVATCDRATRRLGLEQVDLIRTLSEIRDSAVQQRITEFYQI